MKRILCVFIVVISLVFTVSCSQQPTKGAESSISETGDIKRIKVTVDNADIRTGCSNDTPVLQTSDKNSTFDVVSKVADWYAVKLGDNQIGFIPDQKCTPIVAEDKKTDTAPQTPGTQAGATPGATPAPGAGKAPETTKTNDNTLTADEQEMLRLVNDARSQNGFEPLKADMELTNVARIKSQDMVDNNYFSHNSPTYGSPFDMMKDFGINYVKAGENIAGNQNVQAAHDALMNSAGHRKNILSPDYTHIGIGIRKGSSYGNIFTQMFISKPK